MSPATAAELLCLLGSSRTGPLFPVTPTNASIAVTEAAIEEKKEVPSGGNLNGYVISQAPIISQAFCEAPGDTLAVFNLSKSAILSNDQIDGGGAVGNPPAEIAAPANGAPE